MAGVQFAQRMPPQQQAYHQQPNQQQQQAYGGYQQNNHNHAPQLHMQQPHPHQQQYTQPNHGIPQMNQQQQQQHPQQQQQQYYPEHDRVDGKSAGNEALFEQKMREIQALRFEVESLEKANDPNQCAASVAERLGQERDPFNEESEWNMKEPPCCVIQ